jgi:ABC-type glycerol-3-phosphate transport system substrate-binding protein
MGIVRNARRSGMARASVRALLGGSAILLGACAGDRSLGDYPPSSCDLVEPPPDARDVTINIATFWAADDHENNALRTLLGFIDQDRYIVRTDQMTTRVEAQRHINESFANNQLPDVFQVNGGNDVLRWVRGYPADSTDVCRLDRLRDSYGWSDVYFRSALAPLSCRGNLYGLPVGIHHLSVLFYNRKLFEELRQLAETRGVELADPAELKDSRELVRQLETVAQLGATTPEGAAVIPLAIGAQSEWPLTVLAFENVLLSLGHDAYETLWQNGLETDDGSRAAELRSLLEEMVSILRELTTVSNFSQGVSWQDALRQVGDGQALMTVTGDWGWAQLDDATGGDVETVTFPGTAATFVYTPDSFAVPRELRKNGFSARSFLHDVVQNKDTLVAFSRDKHSIPPRSDLTDAEVESLGNETLRRTYRRFVECDQARNGCKLMLAVSGLGPPPGTDSCFDEIDAILRLAVIGSLPAGETLLCGDPPPRTRAEASARLIDLLLSIGRRRIAPDCQ